MASYTCYFCNSPVAATANNCPACGQPQILQGKYRVVRLLGQGGFALVYEVLDLRLNRRYALKLITNASGTAQKQVEAEANILAQHARRLQCMPEIYDIWSDGATTTLVMEYVDGPTLVELVEQHGPWSAYDVAQFLRAVLPDLARIHALGIIHRDLKPDNIKQTSDGHYVLLDFGIAKHTTGVTLTAAKAGSLHYSPPEQIRGQPTDGRSDLYSLGATTYHMLTGQPPIPCEYRAAFSMPLPPPAQVVANVPPSVNNAIMAMLELEPALRPRDADTALALLNASSSTTTTRARGQLPTLPTPPTVRVPTPPSQRLNWGAALLGAGAAIAVVLLFLVKVVSSSSLFPTPGTTVTSVVTAIVTANTASATVGVATVATTVSVPPTTVPTVTVTTVIPSTPTSTETATSYTASVADYSAIGQELANAFAGKYKGKTVSLSHGFAGDEETKFKATFGDFQAKTGITVKLVRGGMVASTEVKVQSGTVTDIVNFEWPGAMASYAKQGKIVDLNKFIKSDWLKKNYKQGFIDVNTVDSPSGKILGGVFERINLKGTVWYPKKAFDDAGYKVPTTWTEFTALMDQIVKDGDTPWCLGIESGGATGWPMTDLVEQMMLRTTSLDNYDKWTMGALPFTSPEVKNAVQQMTNVWLNDKYLYGGRKAVATTNFGDAGTPMFQNPPKCWMLDQGKFIAYFFEKNKPGVKSGVDYDFFPLPAFDDTHGAPVEFGGDLFSVFNDRPEVRALIEYFTTYEAIQPWIKLGGGAISPHNNSNTTDYTTDQERKIAQTVLSAPDVRFDGSELMPAEIGYGSFWKGMTDYTAGTVGLNQALAEIQAGWANVRK